MSINKEKYPEWDGEYINLESENVANIASESLKIEDKDVLIGTSKVDCLVDEKVTQVEGILSSIRKKSDFIKNQTIQLQNFNKKLSILLECIDAYSFVDLEDSSSPIKIEPKDTERIKKEPIDKENNINNFDIAERNIKKIKSQEETIKQQEEIDHLGIINESFKNDAVSMSIAKATYEMILSREKVPLDDIVKSFKYSKYKVIEILNVLIKHKIVLKSFEKGFIYRVNK